jgi:hypothetical protein
MPHHRFLENAPPAQESHMGAFVIYPLDPQTGTGPQLPWLQSLYALAYQQAQIASQPSLYERAMTVILN